MTWDAPESRRLQLTHGLCEDRPARPVSGIHPGAFKSNPLCEVQQNLQGHAHCDGKSENQGRTMTLHHLFIVWKHLSQPPRGPELSSTLGP